MRPASQMGYPRASSDFFITTITIGLQVPFKIIQYLLGGGSPACRLIIKKHRAGNRVMIHPIPPLMGRSLLTGFQNLDRGLVGLQVPPDLGVGEQMLPFDSLVLLPSWAMLYRNKYSRTYKGCQPLLS